LGVPTLYQWVAWHMAPPWDWPYTARVNIVLMSALVVIVASGLGALVVGGRLGALRINKALLCVVYIGVMGFLCLGIRNPMSPPLD